MSSAIGRSSTTWASIASASSSAAPLTGVAEHAQRLARSEAWRIPGRWLWLRLRAPDQFGRVGKQFPRGLDDVLLLLGRHPFLEPIPLGIHQRRDHDRVEHLIP